jgi:hypothetical protein
MRKAEVRPIWNGFDINSIIFNRIYRIRRIFFECSPDESAHISSLSAKEFLPYSFPMI